MGIQQMDEIIHTSSEVVDLRDPAEALRVAASRLTCKVDDDGVAWVRTSDLRALANRIDVAARRDGNS